MLLEKKSIFAHEEIKAICFMRKRNVCAVLFVCLLAACGGNPKTTADSLSVIDVKSAIEHPTELKVSQLGQTVRYVPLETGDSCFVGNRSQIRICGKNIIVTFEGNCLSFDRETGRFIARIGHVGDDPQGYSSTEFSYDDRNGLFYFIRQPNLLQKYDAQGKYHGSVTVPTPPPLNAMPTDYSFTDTSLVGYYANMGRQDAHHNALLLFSADGQVVDTIPSRLPALSAMTVVDIASISVMKFGEAGAILIRYKDGSTSANLAGTRPLWRQDGQLRFKEPFNDTLYTVSAKGDLAPYALFDMGDRGVRLTGDWESHDLNGKQFIVFTLEGRNALFFQCVTELEKTLNGIYDKTAGTVYMAPEADGLTDDLTGFLPFHPSSCSEQGEFASLVWPEKILPWLDEHPEAKDNPALKPLLDIGEEDNPVVVIVQ